MGYIATVAITENNMTVSFINIRTRETDSDHQQLSQNYEPFDSMTVLSYVVLSLSEYGDQEIRAFVIARVSSL